MKITGIILVLVGILWILQGLGIVGGSFMTGQSQWLYIGIVTAIVGVALFAWAARRPPCCEQPSYHPSYPKKSDASVIQYRTPCPTSPSSPN